MADAPVIIYGAGGLGREMLAVVRRCGREAIGFVDDGVAPGTMVAGLPVLGNGDWLISSKAVHHSVLLAFGNPAVRRQVLEKIEGQPHISFCDPLIDPAATITDPVSIQLGRGTVITAGAVLTTGIHLGDHVLVNLNTTIGHDTVIGNCTCIMPGCSISGQVTLGSGVFIGSGAIVLNGLTVGNDSMVGAGSVVNHDVAPGKKVIGSPAREWK